MIAPTPPSSCARLLGILCAPLVLLAGCGTSTPAAPTAQGRVHLPDGAKLDASGLVVATGAGTAAVGKGGAFSAPMDGTGRSLAAVLDRSGRLVLLGYVNGAASPYAASLVGEQSIGATETAAALLYLALGGFTLPVDQQGSLLSWLSRAPETASLASAITARLVVNGTALADGDPEIVEALAQAHASIVAAGQAPAATAAFARGGFARRTLAAAGDLATRSLAPAGLASQALSVPGDTLVLVNPADAQQGLRLGPNPAGEGVILMNDYRRSCYFYAYKTGVEYEDGTREELSMPGVALGATFQEATNGLSGVIGTPIDIWNGKVFWTPVQSAPVVLALDPGTVKTFYQVVAVGPSFDLTSPAFFSDSRFASFTADWESHIQALTLTAFVKDLFLPTMFSWVLNSEQLNEMLKVENPEFISGTIGSLLTKIPDLQGQIQNGEWRDAMLTAVKELSSSDEIRNAMIEAMRLAIKDRAVLDVLHDPEALLGGLSKANAIIAAMDKLMTAGDIGAVLKDIGSSRRGNLWEVTVVQPRVHLDPAESEVKPGHRVYLTARPPDGVQGTLAYHWTLSGTNGHLEDDNGHSGSDFESSLATVAYVGNADLVDGRVDTVTVSVYWKRDDGNGPTHESVFLGQADAAVKGVVPPLCTDLDYSILASGCGSLSLSSRDLTAGDTVTASVYIGCEGVELSVDYALTSNVLVDGVPTAARQGSAGLYSYWGWPYKPWPRGGAAVSLSPGAHTVQFTIRFDAPNDCVSWDPDVSWYAQGPWAILGNGRWSTPVPFRVRQKGI